ncbi:phosphate acetyltransferase [Cryptosporangium arvum]|uniref:Phosphate acetyltransferase n=1 Tax=Cryptosporangium arvum DSM 44712 TaxID=927661 RepID=A0A010ZNP4_9ACTN|nr:phosphate acetyltransferase [Cryptosporangium arvum]EXG80294.1 phosphate acetyltransferase [Cryptosporangium arvum DSM 44712]
MSDILYLTSMEPRSGKSAVALGLLDLLAADVRRLAVFRPVVPDHSRPDPIVELARQRYDLEIAEDDAVAFTYSTAAELIEAGGPQKLIEAIVDHVARLRERYDFVLCVGTDFTGPSPAVELDLNADLAANLGAPVIQVLSGHSRTADAVSTALREGAAVLKTHGCEVLATIVNRAGPEHGNLACATPPVYVVPDLPVLAALTVAEVVAALDGTLLSGDGPALQREVDSYLAGSAYLQTVLPLLKDGTLLVSSGDRIDLAVGVAAAAVSPDLPTPAGIVLTVGHVPDERSLKLLEPSGLPVIAVKADTYTTLHRLEGLTGQLRADSARKVAAALGAFADHVDTEVLRTRIQLAKPDVVTPHMFSAQLIARARADKRTIVLPEGDDDRILLAAEELTQRGVADLVLLGNVEQITAKATQLGTDVTNVRIIDPLTSPLRDAFATTYAELRAHKGVTPAMAYDVVGDVSYFGTMLVHAGEVDGMVSGAAHTTAHTIRPALEVIRTLPDVSLVSSAFLMCLPTKVLVFADCAVVPDPDAAQLADIAVCAAETAVKFGVEPKVAMVSYSTGQSGTGVDVDKVRAATELVGAKHPDLPLAGPIQYDAAVDPAVGAAKLPGNPVAGHATVLIFPDLNTGNTTYKAVQRAASAIAVGPVLQGLRRPVNDLSRGCTVADIVNTVAITAVQAQGAMR